MLAKLGRPESKYLYTACGLAMAAAQEVPERLTSLSHADGYPFQPNVGVMMGDSLYYSRRTVTHGMELWKTDGTAAGTRLVKETIPGMRSKIDGPVDGVVDGGILLFSTGGGGLPEIWKTDGTEAGTVPVITQWQAGIRNGIAQVLSPAPGGGLLFQTYFGGLQDASSTDQIWKTDGTQAGTVRLVKDFAIVGAHVAGDTIWMGGGRLWKSDGTAEGTVVSFSTPSRYRIDILWAMSDDTVLFASSHEGKRMLLRLDAGGITPLKEIGSLVNGQNQPVFVEGDAHFLTFTGEHLQLWRTDGTEAGTRLVKNMPSGPEGSRRAIIPAGGKIYFR
ncbi:MAG: hypothetical protein EOP88_26990, partial [Verrucomicrobiaceae bacterium]